MLSSAAVASATGSGVIPPVVSTAGATSSSILTTGQIVPLSAAQISQLIMPGASAVGGAQQILNVGGQNILVSGSGPGTVGNVSLRYGKILKGVHKYFCNNCNRPFTQKKKPYKTSTRKLSVIG